MRQVLFIQGAGEGVHDQWDNQLVDSLRGELGPSYEIRYPVMPNEADPKYAAWKLAPQREFAALQHGAVVPIFFYHGRDDDTVPFAHVELYARIVPRAEVRRLAGRDHQLNNRLSEVATDIRQLDQSSSADAEGGTVHPGPPRGSTSRDARQ